MLGGRNVVTVLAAHSTPHKQPAKLHQHNVGSDKNKNNGGLVNHSVIPFLDGCPIMKPAGTLVCELPSAKVISVPMCEAHYHRNSPFVCSRYSQHIKHPFPANGELQRIGKTSMISQLSRNIPLDESCTLSKVRINARIRKNQLRCIHQKHGVLMHDKLERSPSFDFGLCCRGTEAQLLPGIATPHSCDAW